MVINQELVIVFSGAGRAALCLRENGQILWDGNKEEWTALATEMLSAAINEINDNQE